MPRSRWCRLLASTLVLVLMASCGGGGSNLVVYTDRADLVLVVHEYLAEHPGLTIDLRYEESLGSLNRSAGFDADLVVGTNILSPPRLDRFAPLDSFLENRGIDASGYLPFTFTAGRSRASLKAVVLGFDLPVLLAGRSDGLIWKEHIDQTIVEPQGIRDMAAQGTRRNGRGVMNRLGLSLFRNQAMLELLASYFGAGFRANQNGTPRWEASGIMEAIEFARSWIKEGPGTVEAEEVFNEIYGNLPDTRVLALGRQSLVYRTLSELDVRTLSSDEIRLLWPGTPDRRVMVLPAMVAAGIPETSRNVEGAMDLIAYLLDPAVQVRHMETVVRENQDSFGFLDAVPVHREVYEQELPLLYPALAQRILPDSLLVAPESEASEWRGWLVDVFRPFMVSAIGSGLEYGALERRTREWLLQKGIQL